MSAYPLATLFSLRSSLPGRQRWDVKHLQQKPVLAERLAHELKTLKGVTEATVNPLTGRVLLLFDPQLDVDFRQIMADMMQRLALALAAIPATTTVHELVDSGSEDVGTAVQERLRRENALLKVIREAETSGTLRWRATGWSIANTVASLIPPVSLGVIMGAAVLGGIPLLTSVGITPLSQIVGMAGVYLAGDFLNTWSEYNAKLAWQRYGTQIEHALRSKAFRHALSLDMAHLENQSSSQLLSVIHDDSVRIRNFLGSEPDSVLDRLTTAIVGGTFLISISPISFVLSLAPLPVIFRLYHKYNQQVGQRFGQVGMREQEARKQLSNSLTGVATIKSFSSEDREAEQLDEISLALGDDIQEAYSDALTYADTTKFAMVAGLGLPIIYAGALVVTGSVAASTFMLQSFIMPKLVGTMGGLDRAYEQYMGASVSARRLAELLAQQAQIQSGPQALPIETVRGDVTFDNISFTYPSSQEPLFEDFSLTIPARTSIAIVGSTGSGKSTLTRLLLRFYDVQEGRVLVDGIDIRSLNLASLRKSIGIVSQDVFLFHGTVYDNILYGRPGATREEVRDAARVAEALEFIDALPEGFDTVVGERGQKLSGGQRQRIAIARVVLKNPPILIFDEATSAVDNETEALIQRSVHRLAVGKTLIVIAHRMSTVRKVDQIFVLENGKVAEHGSHEALLARRGIYAGLWQLQTGEDNGASIASTPENGAVPLGLSEAPHPPVAASIPLNPTAQPAQPLDAESDRKELP